jgi:hypothetical protein
MGSAGSTETGSFIETSGFTKKLHMGRTPFVPAFNVYLHEMKIKPLIQVGATLGGGDSRRWRLQFRCRGSRHEPAMVQVST